MASQNGPFPRCPMCGGEGERVYPDSAGWRGGIGGQTLTASVCDSCWGTGRTDVTGPNQRRMEAAFTRDVNVAVARHAKQLRWQVEQADIDIKALGFEAHPAVLMRMDRLVRSLRGDDDGTPPEADVERLRSDRIRAEAAIQRCMEISTGLAAAGIVGHDDILNVLEKMTFRGQGEKP